MLIKWRVKRGHDKEETHNDTWRESLFDLYIMSDSPQFAFKDTYFTSYYTDEWIDGWMYRVSRDSWRLFYTAAGEGAL